MATSDLFDAARASNLQPEPALGGDCPTVEVVIDGNSVGGEMVPDVGEVVCPSESSASADDGDDAHEASKYGNSSCPSEEPYYFAKESFSKKYGSEVSSHDIAFVRGAPRLVSLWEGELHVVFGIGGHLRTVVDWYRVRKCNETAVSEWLQVSDSARPDVPLWIEFTAVYGKEKVEAGTALQRPNEALVPWTFMCISNRVGDDVNTQVFWIADKPPSGFWTSVPIVCRVTVDILPVGTELFFDIDAVREQYGWSDLTSQFAQECILRLDAGENARSVEYSIVRERAPGLPWAYGGNPASVSRYVELAQSGHPVVRERVGARVLRGSTASSSLQMKPAITSAGRTGRRRDSGEDKVEALWRRAFDADTLIPLAESANSSSFEDPSDRRNAKEKYNWWGMYLAER